MKSMETILDDDIEIKECLIDDDINGKLYDSYKACIVIVLLNMSSAYIELRHYKEAIECLDEAEQIAKDSMPNVFFRRSQARSYNKFSSLDDLNIALIDAEKAISIKDQEIYKEHRENLVSFIKSKKESNLTKIRSYNNKFRTNTRINICNEQNKGKEFENRRSLI